MLIENEITQNLAKSLGYSSDKTPAMSTLISEVFYTHAISKATVELMTHEHTCKVCDFGHNDHRCLWSCNQMDLIDMLIKQYKIMVPNHD